MRLALAIARGPRRAGKPGSINLIAKTDFIVVHSGRKVVLSRHGMHDLFPIVPADG